MNKYEYITCTAPTDQPWLRAFSQMKSLEQRHILLENCFSEATVGLPNTYTYTHTHIHYVCTYTENITRVCIRACTYLYTLRMRACNGL